MLTDGANYNFAKDDKSRSGNRHFANIILNCLFAEKDCAKCASDVANIHMQIDLFDY